MVFYIILCLDIFLISSKAKHDKIQKNKLFLRARKMSLVVANYSRRNLVFDMFGYKDNSMLNKAWWQKIVFANQFISVKIKLQRIIVAWSRATSTCILKLITGEFLLRNEHCLLFRGILYHVAVSTAIETMDLMYEISREKCIILNSQDWIIVQVSDFARGSFDLYLL